MKKIIPFLFLFLLNFNVLPYDKMKFDLDFQTNQTFSFNKSTGRYTEYLTLRNNKTEFTLLSDGYFTIGTTGGLVQDSLDNNCQITFGHPYAMTSYPFFILDGNYKHPELYFNNYLQLLSAHGDTLRLKSTDFATVELQFDLIQQNNGENIRVEFTLINRDTIVHGIGLGLVLDPALGKWGDGYSFMDNQLITNDTLLQSSLPQSIEIWERGVTPKGIGLQFLFVGDPPNQIHIGNWFDLNFSQTSLLPQLYDLTFKMDWSETQVLPLQEVKYSIDLTLLSPDFPNGIFLRADLPRFFSIENNILFPRSVTSLVEIFNNGVAFFQDVKLEVFGGGLIDDWVSPDSFYINSEEKVFKSAILNIPEIYEDQIINISLNAVNNSQFLDQLFRNVYIPAAPFSDTGLVVEIDTIITSNFPNLDLIFQSRVESTGQLLTKLRKENIFFYEDQTRIQNFIIEKDTSGGTNQADIIFVLDVTGSMTAEINGVKDNIVEFTDSLSYNGIDFRLGMVTFLDEIENVYDFTSDVQLFQQYVNQQYAHGGGEIAENSLEALMRATQFIFRPSANRIIIWITDANYHINNQYTQLTIQDVVNELLANAVVTHCIGDPYFQTLWYDPIVLPTGGNFYDINGNFRDILLEISRLPASGSYRISYYSNAATGVLHEVKIEVHYAGLGGSDIITFTPSTKSDTKYGSPKISCYPNPFNPSVHIKIENPTRLKCEVNIFNILGQKVKHFSFNSGQESIRSIWNAKNDSGHSVGNGIYFVQAVIDNNGGQKTILPVQKIIYTK